MKTETLRDGTQVQIRDQTPNDIDLLMEFYNALSEKDRRYLRVDVTDRDVVRQRLDLLQSGFLFRRCAVNQDKIVATGALEIFPDAWREHQGELRVLVSPSIQRRGLGMLMMRELYFLALNKNVELLVTRMMKPQVAARNICRKLGFHEELVVPHYLHDLTGTTQDMVLMACNRQDFWKELEHSYMDSDWRKHR